MNRAMPHATEAASRLTFRVGGLLLGTSVPGANLRAKVAKRFYNSRHPSCQVFVHRPVACSGQGLPYQAADRRSRSRVAYLTSPTS